jgi:hypothetical protein
MMFVVVGEDATETIFVLGDAHKLKFTESFFALVGVEEILQDLIVCDIEAYHMGHVIGFAVDFKGDDLIRPVDEGFADITEIVGTISKSNASSHCREPQEPNSTENARQQLHLNFHTILQNRVTMQVFVMPSPAQA